MSHLLSLSIVASLREIVVFDLRQALNTSFDMTGLNCPVDEKIAELMTLLKEIEQTLMARSRS